MDRRTLNDLASELQAALADAGVPAAVEPLDPTDDGEGEVRVEADGRSLPVLVATRADLRPVHADQLAPPGDDRAAVVVADRIAERSRQVLREAGWGWLDRRRGHLRLWAPGLRIDTNVAPSVVAEVAPKVANPFTPAGRDLSLWLLAHPTESASPRKLHRELGISAGQISNLLQALEGENLLRKDRTPLLPELFWALAEHWSPRRHALASLPTEAERAAATELRADRWVLTDTVAAVALGAPVVAGSSAPPDLYLPDERSLSWLLGRSVVAPDWSQRAATVAVAPTPLVCDPRLRRTGDHWPLAHPVVVALDLATDRGRGRTVVEEWEPDPASGVIRVW